jgi:hypothetical protein
MSVRAEMVKVGLDPVINLDVLEIFTDGEVTAAIKDGMFRLLRFRRLEGEL